MRTPDTSSEHLRPIADPHRHWLASGLLVALLISMLMSKGVDAESSKPQPPLPTIELLIGDQMLSAEVASTSMQRYMGLSFRKALDKNAGMLFAYPDERDLTFTMRNTLLPLSIAYISKELVINEIQNMDVGPNQLFPSKAPAMYALEVNQGWFERHGLEPGTKIEMKLQR